MPAAEDFELCNECGGLCCCHYLAQDEDGGYIGEGWLPEYIELWLQRLRESGALPVTDAENGAGPAGIEPLHDPRLSHLKTAEGEAYRPLPMGGRAQVPVLSPGHGVSAAAGVPCGHLPRLGLRALATE